MTADHWTLIAPFITDNDISQLIQCGSPHLSSVLALGVQSLELDATNAPSSYVSIGRLLAFTHFFRKLTDLSVKTDLRLACPQWPENLDGFFESRTNALDGSSPSAQAPGAHLHRLELQFKGCARLLLSSEMRLDLKVPSLRILKLVDSQVGCDVGKSETLRVECIPSGMEEFRLEMRELRLRSSYDFRDLYRHMPVESLRIFNVIGFLCDSVRTLDDQFAVTDDDEARMDENSSSAPSDASPSNNDPSKSDHKLVSFAAFTHLTDLRIELGGQVELLCTSLPSSLRHLHLSIPPVSAINDHLGLAFANGEGLKRQGVRFSSLAWSSVCPSLESLSFATMGSGRAISWEVLARMPSTLKHLELSVCSRAKAREALKSLNQPPRDGFALNAQEQPLEEAEKAELLAVILELASRLTTLKLSGWLFGSMGELPDAVKSSTTLKEWSIDFLDISSSHLDSIGSGIEKMVLNRPGFALNMPKGLKTLEWSSWAIKYPAPEWTFPSTLTRFTCPHPLTRTHIESLPSTLTDLVTVDFELEGWIALACRSGDLPQSLANSTNAEDLERVNRFKDDPMRLHYLRVNTQARHAIPFVPSPMDASHIPTSVTHLELGPNIANSDDWYTNFARHPSLTHLRFWCTSTAFLKHLPPTLRELKLTGLDTILKNVFIHNFLRFDDIIPLETATALPRGLRILDFSDYGLPVDRFSGSINYITFSPAAAAALPPRLSIILLPALGLARRATFFSEEEAHALIWNYHNSLPPSVAYLDFLIAADRQEWDTKLRNSWDERKASVGRPGAFKAAKSSRKDNAQQHPSSSKRGCIIQ